MNKKWIVLLGLLIAGCATPPATVDPFVAVAKAERTAQAAQEQADYYSRQLTATAEAPIIEITRQAAAWELQQQHAQATAMWAAVTQSAVSTATAQSWTPTPMPTITPNATATMVSARTNAEIKKLEQETARAEMTNVFWAIILPIFLLALLLVLAFVGIAYARQNRVQIIQRDARGDAPIVRDLVTKETFDVDRNPNYSTGEYKDLLWQAFEQWLERNHGFTPKHPHNTAERQDRVTERDQSTDLKVRTKPDTRLLARLPKANDGQAHEIQPVAISDADNNLPLPPWDFIKRWDGTSKPLGFGRAGLITAKSASPHILISGMTGSGKTIFMMRTLTATSLANGSQVVNIGYSNAGYGVFEHHVNYHSVQLPNPSDVIECLAQVYEELKSRKTLIGGETIEWEYWPGGQPPRPFLDLMLDELGNMAEDIFIEQGPTMTKELWSYISRIANEGRKVGIRFVAALQDPTSKSMDLRFRRNCTLVAFRQGDRTQSDTFIGAPGAEQLSVGHFMARTDSLVIGGGFSPTDTEILQYLSTHKVAVMEKPKWIDAVSEPRIDVHEPTPFNIIEPTASESLPATKPVDEIAEMAESIRAQWTPRLSKTKVAKLLGFPQYGGSYIGKVDRVIDYLTATTTTTIERNSPENGVFEAIPA